MSSTPTLDLFLQNIYCFEGDLGAGLDTHTSRSRTRVPLHRNTAHAPLTSRNASSMETPYPPDFFRFLVTTTKTDVIEGRRHIPTGVLFDLLAGVPEANGGREVDPDDLRGDRDDGDAGPRSGLPWRITVHFQGCPRRQVGVVRFCGLRDS